MGSLSPSLSTQHSILEITRVKDLNLSNIDPILGIGSESDPHFIEVDPKQPIFLRASQGYILCNSIIPPNAPLRSSYRCSGWSEVYITLKDAIFKAFHHVFDAIFSRSTKFNECGSIKSPN